ncbi:permease [Halanaerobium kushneri]|uniref:permease n=1 Tax=Halanaerobium kushneri TaxID=56779 RepID=UPI0009712971
MFDILQREFIYLWYYFTVLLEQIFPYWIIGMMIGSLVSVFGKGKIQLLLSNMQSRKWGLFGIVPACILGIASPLCMYGTIPIAASFSEKGMRDDWLAAFMISSILLNPQLIVYSMALGNNAFFIRIISAFLAGITAGLLVYIFYRDKSFFDFSSFGEARNRDTDPNSLFRFLKNFGRNVKATGLYFFFGILLTAMFQRYVPENSFVNLFGSNEGFGVLMAATLGVPLYFCGGGTIPLLMQWLHSGMSIGAAASFMITGPATKLTNLGAVKIVLGANKFIMYLAYNILFALVTGLVVNIF